ATMNPEMLAPVFLMVSPPPMFNTNLNYSPGGSLRGEMRERGRGGALLLGLDALLHEHVDQLVPVGAERVGRVQEDLAGGGHGGLLQLGDAFGQGADEKAGFLPLF